MYVPALWLWDRLDPVRMMGEGKTIKRKREDTLPSLFFEGRSKFLSSTATEALREGKVINKAMLATALDVKVLTYTPTQLIPDQK